MSDDSAVNRPVNGAVYHVVNFSPSLSQFVWCHSFCGRVNQLPQAL